VGGSHRSFRKYVKGLAEGRDHFAFLPAAVRSHEVQQAAFFARFLLRKQPLGVPGKVEKRDTLVLVGFVGVLVPFNLAQAAVLLLVPLVRHFLEEGRINEAVKLVNIHSIDAVLKPLWLNFAP